MKYVAFLRGINVGGRNMIKMSDLKVMFVGLGFQNVTTYLQSGNALFETKRSSHKAMVSSIEAVLPGNTRVIVRSALEIAQLVASDPFTSKHTDARHRFVTFLQETADGEIRVKPGTEIVLRTKQELCWYFKPVKGRFEYPNIEAQLKVAATTRGWGVVQTIGAMLSA